MNFWIYRIEVKQLLKDYNLSEKMDEVKEWYDGYQFAIKKFIIHGVHLCMLKYNARCVFKPISFWANTSGNDIVVKYIQKDKKLRKGVWIY